jgi:hypothetical protein
MDTLRVVPLLAIVMTATLKADPAVDIAVDVTALASQPPRERRALVRETEALWRPSGVRLTWVHSSLARAWPQTALTLEVSLEDRQRPAAPKDGLLRLGFTTFQSGAGGADRRVTLSASAVEKLVDEVVWSGRRVLDWPPAVREELVGRALGRVLAHEIGHVLFAWRLHTRYGLMRPEFGALQLIERDRKPFTLPADLLPRLRAHLDQLSGRAATLMAVE